MKISENILNSSRLIETLKKTSIITDFNGNKIQVGYITTEKGVRYNFLYDPKMNKGFVRKNILTKSGSIYSIRRQTEFSLETNDNSTKLLLSQYGRPVNKFTH